MSFSDFLKELEMDLHTYLLAVRSSICSPKIFLKRLPCETRVNNYNTIALKCWEANMDIQFILDPYACVSYIELPYYNLLQTYRIYQRIRPTLRQIVF